MHLAKPWSCSSWDWGAGGEDPQDPHWHLSSAWLPAAVQLNGSSTIWWAVPRFPGQWDCQQRRGKPSHDLTALVRQLSPGTLCMGEKPSLCEEVETAPRPQASAGWFWMRVWYSLSLPHCFEGPVSLGSSLSITLGFLPLKSSFWLWRKELKGTGGGGEEASEEVQGRKPLPVPFLLGQQKKQTTVNAAAPQPACRAGALTWGPDQGMGQRFLEQEGLEKPVRDWACPPHDALLLSPHSTGPAAGAGRQASSSPEDS